MHKHIKNIIGIMLTVWFLGWAYSFIQEPNRHISQITSDIGITPDHWAVLFLGASFLTALHVVFKWRWNIIILIPYILHTSALVFYKVGDNFAPLESVILRLTLLGLLLIEMYTDWRIRWRG